MDKRERKSTLLFSTLRRWRMPVVRHRRSLKPFPFLLNGDPS
ncbi:MULTISPECIES: hypothetical protein [Burkholderia cepacia complex]|nr:MULTISPECIES: hypothetical protein [Burkholderia cepacia complex]